MEVEPGIFLEVAEIPGKVPMLCLHGNGETNASFSDVQTAFANLGFNVYQFDYRGIGNSPGWPSESRLYKDADTVLEWIARKQECRPCDVVVVGQSVGSGPASYLAEKHNSHLVVLYAAFTSLKDVVQLKPIFRHFVPFIKYEFSNLGRLQNWSKLDGKGTLVLVHGRWDELVPFFQCEQLKKNVELCAHEKRRVLCIAMEDANHNDIIEQSWTDVSTIVMSELLTPKGC